MRPIALKWLTTWATCKGGGMPDTALIRELSDMIYRKSPMIADNLGLVLTQQDLEQLEQMIVARWVQRVLTEPFMPRIGTM